MSTTLLMEIIVYGGKVVLSKNQISLNQKKLI